MKMNSMEWIAFVLVVVGGLNWGLVGLLDLDLVATLFGEMTTLSRIVYSVVGISTVYLLIAVASKSGKDAA